MKDVATLGVGSTDIYRTTTHASWSIGINTAKWYPPVGLPTTLIKIIIGMNLQLLKKD